MKTKIKITKIPSTIILLVYFLKIFLLGMFNLVETIRYLLLFKHGQYTNINQRLCEKDFLISRWESSQGSQVFTELPHPSTLEGGCHPLVGIHNTFQRHPPHFLLTNDPSSSSTSSVGRLRS